MASNSVEAFYMHGPDQPVIIDTPEQMEDLINLLVTSPASHNIAALYHRARPTNALDLPDHEVYIAVNGREGVGGLMYSGDYEGEDGTWFSKGTPVRKMRSSTT